MSTDFSVRALDSVVRIELDESLSEADRAVLHGVWADLITLDHDAPVQTIRAGIGEPAEGRSPDEPMVVRAASTESLADELTSAVTLAAISALAGDALMLHASAVALDDGRVIGFVGPSGRGKTTAALQLGRHFGYVTDETLAVRRDGTVIAFPKPLSIGERPAHKRPIAASSLALRPLPAETVRLAALVLLDRRPGFARPVIDSVSLRDALEDLVPQTSFFPSMDRPLRTLVELLDSVGGARRVTYSEASTLIDVVDEILEPADSEATWLTDVTEASKRDCDCARGPEDIAIGGEGTYRRTNHVDAVLLDDSLLVLRTDGVTVLEGIGPVVWLAASNSTDDDLREAALRELPEPPEGVDAAKAVSEAVRQLVDAGLLAKR